jgi:Helix-turn-helix domain
MLTLDPQLRDALPHIRAAGQANWYVLTAYCLHANTRGRAWPSLDTLARETGYNRKTVLAARQWLIVHRALLRVSPGLRLGDEAAHPHADVLQVSGMVEVAGQRFRTLTPGDTRQQSAGWTDGSPLAGLSEAQPPSSWTGSSPAAPPEVAATAATGADRAVRHSAELATLAAVWEQEAGQPLTPLMGDVLAGLLDAYGVDEVVSAMREATSTAGAGRFGVKYVRRILERWGGDAEGGEGEAADQRGERDTAPRDEPDGEPGPEPDFGFGRRVV